MGKIWVCVKNLVKKCDGVCLISSLFGKNSQFFTINDCFGGWYWRQYCPVFQIIIEMCRFWLHLRGYILLVILKKTCSMSFSPSLYRWVGMHYVLEFPQGNNMAPILFEFKQAHFWPLIEPLDVSLETWWIFLKCYFTMKFSVVYKEKPAPGFAIKNDIDVDDKQ